MYWLVKNILRNMSASNACDKCQPILQSINDQLSAITSQLQLSNAKLDALSHVAQKLDDVSTSLQFTQDHFDTVVKQVIPALVTHN